MDTLSEYSWLEDWRGVHAGNMIYLTADPDTPMILTVMNRSHTPQVFTTQA